MQLSRLADKRAARYKAISRQLLSNRRPVYSGYNGVPPAQITSLHEQRQFHGRRLYFFLKSLLRNLILPPAGLLIVTVVGALLLWRRRRFGGPLLTVGLGSLWLLATPIVADSLSHLAEHYPALDVSKPTNAKAIVILAGGGKRLFAPEYGGPMVENELLERLSYGAFVARRTALPVLITGNQDEAVAMRASLVRDFGVQPAWIENQSHDTFDNAKFSAQILQPLGIKRIILVTSSEHLWRAAHEFQDAGMDVVPAPAGVWVPREVGALRFIPGPGALVRSRTAVYELLGEPVRRLLDALRVRQFLYRRTADADDR